MLAPQVSALESETNHVAVGQCLIQLAKAEGAACILATAGTDEKTKFCEQLGATKGINYKKTKWEDEVKKVAPDGVDLIVDFILGSCPSRLFLTCRAGISTK
jgi:NADPH:quinone reductase-like Zn-dependent oxidoreductase